MKKLKIDKKNSRIARQISVIVGLTVLSLGLYGYGVQVNNNLVNHSATKIGSTATFKRSDATATITNYYTDKERDVLIARISIDQSTTNPMPYRSTDYLVLQIQDGVSTQVPLIFGRVGTDGDLFVIIPNPEPDKVYKLAIINYNYLGNDVSVNTDSESVDLDSQSIAKALSNATDLTKSDDDSSSDSSVDTDNVIFQFTLNPAVETKDYQAETLSVKSLWKTNKKGELVFNFEKYWELVYKQPLIESTQKRLQEISDTISKLQEQLQTAEDTLSENPKDEAALSKKSSLETQIKNQQEIQEEQSENLKNYRNLSFDEADFDDYITSVSTYQDPN